MKGLSTLIFLIVVLVVVKFSCYKEDDGSKAIDYNHEPDFKQIYGNDLHHKVDHLLARDEDHVHPEVYEEEMVQNATKKILEAQKKYPKSFKLSKDLIHLNYFANSDMAIQECKRMLALNPRDTFMLIHIAHLQSLAKQYKMAIINANKALTIKSSEEGNYIIGYCYYYLGQMKNAIQYLKKVTSRAEEYEVAQALLKKAEQY
jgi:tetratricopeptide (TPR) repeat protein